VLSGLTQRALLLASSRPALPFPEPGDRLILPCAVKKHSDDLSGTTTTTTVAVPLGLFFFNVNDGSTVTNAEERVDGPLIVQQCVATQFA
jgi:hypothetical protein